MCVCLSVCLTSRRRWRKADYIPVVSFPNLPHTLLCHYQCCYSTSRSDTSISAQNNTDNANMHVHEFSLCALFIQDVYLNKCYVIQSWIKWGQRSASGISPLETDPAGRWEYQSRNKSQMSACNWKTRPQTGSRLQTNKQTQIKVSHYLYHITVHQQSKTTLMSYKSYCLLLSSQGM